MAGPSEWTFWGRDGRGYELTKKEREALLAAIDYLEANPCMWEDAMSRLYALAGIEYNDPRKMTGTPVSLSEIMTGKKPTDMVEG